MSTDDTDNLSVSGVTIYAAGAIDLVDGDEMDWREHLQMELDGHGVNATIFNPASSYMCSTPNGMVYDATRPDFIFAINSEALRAADVFVAVVSSEQASIGTPIEMHMANDHCTYSYVITDIPEGKSVYLDKYFTPERRFYIENLSDPDDMTSALVNLVLAIKEEFQVAVLTPKMDPAKAFLSDIFDSDDTLDTDTQDDDSDSDEHEAI